MTPFPTRRQMLGLLCTGPVCGALPALATTPAPPTPTPSPTPPALMLAQSFHPGIDVRDYRVSEKYDGVRGYWDGRQLWSRSGLPVLAPDWFTQGWPGTPMDGEIWAGRGAFDQVAGTLRQQPAQVERWRRLRFMAFDLPAAEGAFDLRHAALVRLLGQGGAHIAAVVTQQVADAAALRALLQRTVAAGGEGLMLHRGDAPYRAQRSDDLLKLKPHADAEAQVLSHEEGRGKHAGRLGALWVQTPQGIRFKLGTGFSDAERTHPPAPGAWVVYQYSGLTAKCVPRFARFLRVREAVEG
jgi:DNA ligase-1